MKSQVRVLLILVILALAAGWVGLRLGNARLEQRLAARSAGAAEVAR